MRLLKFATALALLVGWVSACTGNESNQEPAGSDAETGGDDNNDDDGGAELDADVDAQADEDLDAEADAAAGDDANTGPALIRPCAELQPEGSTLLELGPTFDAKHLFTSDTRILLATPGQDWTLRDRIDNRIVATGGFPCLSHLRDSLCIGGEVLFSERLLLLQFNSRLELRDAVDGHLRGTISYSSAEMGFGAPDDGSYVWISSTSGLTIFSPTGALLATRDGDYRSAGIYAAPGQLQVVAGPAGTNVIERISSMTGASTVSPAFEGTFYAWFEDGERFVTFTYEEGLSPKTQRIYSAAVQLEKSFEGARFAGGRGDLYWSRSDTEDKRKLDFYRVSGDEQIVYTVTPLGYAARSHNGFFLTTAGFLDVRGPGARVTSAPASFAGSGIQSAPEFAANLAGDLVVQNLGALWLKGADDKAFRPLNCGAMLNVTASKGHRWAVAVGAYQVLVIDPLKRVIESVLPLPRRWFLDTRADLEFTADGSRLAVQTDGAVNVFALDTGALLSELPAPQDSSVLLDFQISGDGERIGRMWFDQAAEKSRYRVSDPDGSTTYLSVELPMPEGSGVAALSESGLRAAVGARRGDDWEVGQTEIYDGSARVGTVAGWPVLWLDEDRLLIKRARDLDPPAHIIVDRSGTELSRPALPRSFKPLGEGLIYADAAIHRADSGQLVWRLDLGRAPIPPQIDANDAAVVYAGSTNLGNAESQSVFVEPYLSVSAP